jgi:hypothetical protein
VIITSTPFCFRTRGCENHQQVEARFEDAENGAERDEDHGLAVTSQSHQVKKWDRFNIYRKFLYTCCHIRISSDEKMGPIQ